MIRGDAEKKLGRIETMAPIEEAVVTFAVNGHSRNTRKVEVLLRLEEGFALRAEERTDDMYASVDDIADKLERRLRKLKEKIRRRLRREGMSALAETQLEVEDAWSFEIKRVKHVDLKPMDVEEAILAMNMLDGIPKERIYD